MAGPAYPGPYNGYVASPEASGGLLVGFSRNVADFPINSYTQMFPTTQMFGLYQSYTSRNAARIVSNTDAEHVWADGDARPTGQNNLESWQFNSYKTTRRAYDFTVGQLTVEQMTFDLLMQNSRDMGQQCMTARTMLVQSALAGAAWGANTAAVNNGILPNGQTWANGITDVGSGVGPNIFTSLQYGAIQIHLATIGVVKPNMLTLVVNPVLAQTMGRSQEIRNYLKQSVYARQMIRGDDPDLNGQWNLPNQLYGYNLRVEDAVRVSTAKNQAFTATTGYVMGNNVAYLVARQGELVGLAGGRSYSTVQNFFYRNEMTVQTMYDQPNERYLGSVVTNYVPVVATTFAGFAFTACI